MDSKSSSKERKHHKRHKGGSSHEAPEPQQHRNRRSVAGFMHALRPRGDHKLTKAHSETSASVVSDIMGAGSPPLPRTMSTSPRTMSSAAAAASLLPPESDSDAIELPTATTERAALPDDAVLCAIATTSLASSSTNDLVSVDPPPTPSSTSTSSSSHTTTTTSSSSSYCASLTTIFPVPVVPLRDFQVIRLIGCGAVGTVFLAQLRGTDMLFAMKVITKNRVRHSRKSIDSVLAERKFLATQPGHPFINKLFYACHTALHLILVLEYCSAGDLLAAIKRQPGSRFSEEQARSYIAEIVMALEYIHYKGFLYRDIKPENILLHADSHIRVIDFGLAKHQADYRMEQKMVVKKSLFSRKTKLTISNGPGPLMRTNSLVGSAFYVAPEMLKAQKSERGYDSRADWWALGVLLYEMLVGRPPFQGEQLPDVFGSIAQCAYEIPSDITCSKEAKHLLSRLMCPNPETRLGGVHGAQEVKQHPFFRDVQWALVRHSTPPSLGEWISDDPVSLLTPEQAFEHLEFMTAVNQDAEINPPDADFDSFPYCAPEFVDMLASRQKTIDLLS